MINPVSFSRDWIFSVRDQLPGKDPILIEKMIMALALVEQLKLAGLDFVFKGGTSILLMLDKPERFSIDVDIILPERGNIDRIFQTILELGVFRRVEENIRKGNLPKEHYKFYFQSCVQNKSSFIGYPFCKESIP